MKQQHHKMGKSTLNLRSVLLSMGWALSVSAIVSCSNDEEITSSRDLHVSIPDIEFETLLVEQGIDSDGLVNQRMLRSDAEAVTRLNLNLDEPFGDISDLTGIEAFVNLTKLTAARHPIWAIDLSQNTQLDTLYLQANLLSSLDLSNNPQLMVVDVQYNELKTIEGLSSAAGLKELNLSGNYLSSLTLENESLEILLADDNQLVNVDLRDSPNLRSARLSSNFVRSIDVGANRSLEVLVISGNQIQRIDLSASESLQYLYISSNALKALDVSKNHALIDLRADRNPDLHCITVDTAYAIPTVKLSTHQQVNISCE